MGKRRLMFASAMVVAAGIGAGGVATAHGGHRHFFVTLRGAQEVPPADPDGRATARLDIDPDDHQVCWDLRYTNLAPATLAHIHKAPRGSNGGVVVAFFDGSTDHPLPDADALERGRVDGCTENVDSALLTDISTNPDQYYVNIHNARFPLGAVRGQIR